MKDFVSTKQDEEYVWHPQSTTPVLKLLRSSKDKISLKIPDNEEVACGRWLIFRLGIPAHK